MISIINLTPSVGTTITRQQLFTFTIKSTVAVDISSISVVFNGDPVVNGSSTDPNYSVIATLNVDGISWDYQFSPLYLLPQGSIQTLQIRAKDIYGLPTATFISQFIVEDLRPRLLNPIFPTSHATGVNPGLTLHFVVNKTASDHSLDAYTLNVKLDGYSMVSNGTLQPGYDGYFSAVIDDADPNGEIEVLIDFDSPLSPNCVYDIFVEINEPTPYGKLYADKYEFTTGDNKENVTPAFPGYFYGLYRAESLGDGYAVRLHWQSAQTTSSDYDLAYLVYCGTESGDVFQTPLYITQGIQESLPELTDGKDANFYGKYTYVDNPVGVSYYYGVRATEFPRLPIQIVPPDGVSSFPSGWNLAADGYNYIVPASQVLRNPLAISGAAVVTVISTTNFPNVGYINLGGTEIVRYDSLTATQFNIPLAGRAAMGTSSTSHAINEPVTIYYGNSDDNGALAHMIVDWRRPNNPHRTRPDLVTTSFTTHESEYAEFEPYDFCGWHNTRPDELFTGNCQRSYAGGNFGGYRGLNLWEQMEGREEALLEMTGEPVVYLRRLWDGERCVCTNSRVDSSRMRSCSFCFGTGFTGGFHQYINPRRNDTRIMLHFSTSEENVKLGFQSAFEQDNKPSAWTISLPAIKDRDLVVRYNEFGQREWIYEVLNSSRIKPFLGKYGRQKLALQRLDKTDPRYQIIIV